MREELIAIKIHNGGIICSVGLKEEVFPLTFVKKWFELMWTFCIQIVSSCFTRVNLRMTQFLKSSILISSLKCCSKARLNYLGKQWFLQVTYIVFCHDKKQGQKMGEV